jgi:hypothetical protein
MFASASATPAPRPGLPALGTAYVYESSGTTTVVASPTFSAHEVAELVGAEFFDVILCTAGDNFGLAQAWVGVGNTEHNAHAAAELQATGWQNIPRSMLVGNVVLVRKGTIT